MTRLHLVDGTFELFRAHYGKRPPHFGPDGQDLKATVGVVSSLISLLEDPVERATHLAVAFDNPIESFRNELFEGYKTGAGMEPALVAQMGPVEEAVRALGVVVWSMDRHEADDALATGAKRFADQVEQNPNAIALRDATDAWTYAEVDRYASEEDALAAPERRKQLAKLEADLLAAERIEVACCLRDSEPIRQDIDVRALLNIEVAP